jgi:hypothetical protein
MLVQTLSITTPPIVQDFDWPALVQQVQREKGSEQVSIIDVGGGMRFVFPAFFAWRSSHLMWLKSVQGWGLCFTCSWRTFLHRR